MVRLKSKNYRYIESILQKTVLSKIVLSCQNNNQKSIHTDYIYPISYKIAKKGNPDEMDLLY